MRQILKYKFIPVLLFAVLLNKIIAAQDLQIPRNYINTLASPEMQGRGYINNGDKKAALYIKKELQLIGAKPLGDAYFQEFSFPMNTFPGKMEVQLDNKILKPVYDYVVAPECKSTKGTFPLHYFPQAADTIDEVYDSIIKLDYSSKFVVDNLSKRDLREETSLKSSGIVIARKNVYWWASTGHYEAKIPAIVISDSLMSLKPKTITVNFKNKFKKKHTTQNVLAYVKGTQIPDTFLVFTAHYDHLGLMGKGNIFRGANDNASGTAMTMWLAQYFSQPEKRPKYSVAFLLFAAEESGLIGSSYFVDNPQIPLSQIKGLINLDMVGSGSEGLSIVNGEANTKLTKSIQSINNKHNFFTDIRVGKGSCNSDHCFFDKADVPSVFIFTRGKEFTEYHNLDDVPENLPLTKFSELYKLLIEWVNTY